MDLSLLSGRYHVRPLTESDISEILALCSGNPLFYEHCPPFVTEKSIREDMALLPPGKKLESKHYLGFFDRKRLAAVLDLIEEYPEPETAFVGFFMLDRSLQGRGEGSRIVMELFAALAGMGFRSVRLAWVQTNPQAECFWKKNGFQVLGVRSFEDGPPVVYAERKLT